MNKYINPIAKLTGQCFRDSEGQRWWVRGPRPGPEAQLVVEAEVKGSYPRFAVYTMTEPEFREYAKVAHLRPDKPGAHRRSDKR